MHNHRFNPITSNVILGALVGVASVVIWFTVHAFEEIASIEATLSSTTQGL